MFSGPRAPVASALRWCGWQVIPVDWCWGDGHNLADPQVQQQHDGWLEQCDAQMWAPACDTLTRAREIAIPGHQCPPKPLRKANFVRGVSGLSGELLRRVEEANSFIDYTWHHVELAVQRDTPVVVESPRDAWLWAFPQAIDLNKYDSWRFDDYDACAHLAARCKRQRLGSNVSELRQSRARCGHLHSSTDWTPWCDECGKWQYPGHSEAEYSAHLAFTIAVAMSWMVVRQGKFALPIPRFPAVLEAGCRQGWADISDDVMRVEIFPQVAGRIGLWPPPVQDGSWFPFHWYRGQCAFRLAAEDLQNFQDDRVQDVPSRRSLQGLLRWKDEFTYIGGGCRRFGLGKSMWYPPSSIAQLKPPHKHSRYCDWILGSPHLCSQLASLRGCTLVCSCKKKNGCLVESLQTLFCEGFARADTPSPIFLGIKNSRNHPSVPSLVSPFRPEVDASPKECLVRYVDWFFSDGPCAQQARAAVPHLYRSPVVCDCCKGDPCHTEFLIALANFQARWPDVPIFRRRVVIFASYVVIDGFDQHQIHVPPPVPVRWPQEALVKAIRKLFPAEWTHGWKVPILEDIVNGEPFDIFPRWLEEHTGDGSLPKPPAVFARNKRGQRAASEQQQKGHHFTKEALAQVIPLGLSFEEHFDCTLAWQEKGRFPLDDEDIIDDELECAAAWMLANRKDLANARTRIFKPVKALSERLQGLSQLLRRWQQGTVAIVASQVHTGLFAAGVILMSWPDQPLPRRYVTGFRSIGPMEKTGVLREVPQLACISKEEFLKGAPEAVRQLEAQRVDHDAQAFLVQEAEQDFSRGFGSELMVPSELDSIFGPGQWLPLPRFEITQPNGKKRAIDDGRRYGHNLATSYVETIDAIPPTQPARHLKAVVRQAIQMQIPREELVIIVVETGGEDLPHAYRWVPNHPDDNDINVCGMYDGRPGAQCWKHQILYGQVFGKASAVVIFHRPQRFAQSLSRRWLMVLMSMYFDDATVQDFQAARGRGQRYMGDLFEMLGIPFADDKHVELSQEADFLGLDHTVGPCFATGVVKFRPRTRLREKVQNLTEEMLQTKTCTPAGAGKLRGLTGFTMCGHFGKVGRTGQQSILQRQYWDSEPWSLSHGLERAIIYAQQLSQLDLSREVRLFADPRSPIAIASDGRLDESGPPTIAVVLVDSWLRIRVSWVATIPMELISRWSAISDKYIALVEQAAVVMGIVEALPLIRGRNVLWLEDNANVLGGLVKGANHGEDLDNGVAAIHLLLAHSGTRIWWEYVESDANWADGASRLLAADPFLKHHGFEVRDGRVPVWPWTTPADQRVALVQNLFVN